MNKNSKTPIKSMILLPTRELAFQCAQMLSSLIKYISSGVSYTCLTGGMNLNLQANELKTQPDIIIATPGRLIDMIYNYKSVSIDYINILVLDEADKLLELGFKEAILEIVNLIEKNKNRQKKRYKDSTQNKYQ